MHEMRVGPEPGSGKPVWHVVTGQRGTSLCGADVPDGSGPSRDETDHHCLPCMTRFQQLLEAGR